MSKACVGCGHHLISTRYSKGCQSLFLDHSCQKRGKSFLKASHMPRLCDDREEREAGQTVAIGSHKTEDYVGADVVEGASVEEMKVF